MDTIKEHAQKYSAEGYSCSQIMILLSEEYHGRSNPSLVRAMHGLAGGLCCGETCGTLTGGCCLIGLYTGKDQNHPPNPLMRELVPQYVEWFRETAGHLNCRPILDKHGDKAVYCPGLMAESFQKCAELLQENGIDLFMQDDN